MYVTIKIQSMNLGGITETWYLRVDITAGRLPLEPAHALGVGLFESLLVTCGHNQAERRIGQVWLDCTLLRSSDGLWQTRV